MSFKARKLLGQQLENLLECHNVVYICIILYFIIKQNNVICSRVM